MADTDNYDATVSRVCRFETLHLHGRNDPTVPANMAFAHLKDFSKLYSQTLSMSMLKEPEEFLTYRLSVIFLRDEHISQLGVTGPNGKTCAQWSGIQDLELTPKTNRRLYAIEQPLGALDESYGEYPDYIIFKKPEHIKESQRYCNGADYVSAWLFASSLSMEGAQKRSMELDRIKSGKGIDSNIRMLRAKYNKGESLYSDISAAL
ncbi:hypothetical protein MBM_09276 [Drepanopeziza brunnea f. sp. 'multigermtubi' MB_m1]|uniref:Uncharacterized protein n=1 Tax=Marssonina brunnea f. sp. multigermtubi (strain MB_m1) TaxID=1072389 RepID=K1W6C4_MARBU|nr:uncharacterized protein MBM_09276 [Drepanopeziza brunnea f. sp. 'multigermtubi' MB_m1]EKD12520.1 hypothetical protein MBM_09276 [Drepanopeziza brunnea f. sp. 'multigermtubi' MB_m1]